MIIYIENGFQMGLVTGAVFIDLTAAYDTINLCVNKQKIISLGLNSSKINMLHKSTVTGSVGVLFGTGVFSYALRIKHYAIMTSVDVINCGFDTKT